MQTTRAVQLRRQFPRIPFEQFREVLNTFGEEDPEIVPLLAAYDEEADKQQEISHTAIQARLLKIDASLVHRHLPVHVPDGVDLEHLQALLIHGFVAPSRRETFAGRRSISFESLHEDIRNKLGEGYREPAFHRALGLLTQHGVVRCPGGYSLNLDNNSSGLTSYGKYVIDKVKAFMHEHRLGF